MPNFAVSKNGSYRYTDILNCTESTFEFCVLLHYYSGPIRLRLYSVFSLFLWSSSQHESIVSRGEVSNNAAAPAGPPTARPISVHCLRQQWALSTETTRMDPWTDPFTNLPTIFSLSVQLLVIVLPFCHTLPHFSKVQFSHNALFRRLKVCWNLLCRGYSCKPVVS